MKNFTEQQLLNEFENTLKNIALASSENFKIKREAKALTEYRFLKKLGVDDQKLEILCTKYDF